MSRIPKELLFGIGLLCMLVALFLQAVTLAGQRYGPTLLASLGFAAVADLCLAILVWRGPWGWRAAAMAIMLLTLLIVEDFLRRAPGALR